MQPSINWAEVIAYLINTVLVVLIVQGMNKVWPMIKEKYGFIIPLASPIIALAINTIGKVIGDLLGYPVDFSPIVAVITGTTAVWGHQLFHQMKAEKRGA
jgi:hypothetical protein